MHKSMMAALAALLGLLAISCSGSRMTRSDMNPAWTGKPIQKVLIIAVIDDSEIRGIYETHFMERLHAAGVEAVSSAHILPVSVGEKLDNAAIVDLVERNGSDTVAISHLVGREESETFSRANRLSHIYNRGYYRYYTDVWDYVHAPTVYTDHVLLCLETRLYDVKTQALIWSGTSETMDPGTIGKAIGQVVSLVMNELEKNGLLKDR